MRPTHRQTLKKKKKGFCVCFVIPAVTEILGHFSRSVVKTVWLKIIIITATVRIFFWARKMLFIAYYNKSVFRLLRVTSATGDLFIKIYNCLWIMSIYQNSQNRPKQSRIITHSLYSICLNLIKFLEPLHQVTTRMSQMLSVATIWSSLMNINF